MKKFLIENAVLVTDPLEGTLVHDQSVVIEGDGIAEVGLGAALRQSHPDAERIDGKGQWLLPGLVDAHTHLYGALIGAKPPAADPPQNFPQVLERVWWPWDRMLTPADNALSARIGCVASLHNGITTIFDHHASPGAVENSLSLLAEEIEHCGLRACLAYEVTDRNGLPGRDAGMAENRRFILECRSRQDDRIRGLYGLHAVFSLSDESLRLCADEAADLGTGCHLHVAEHLTEVQKFARDHTVSILEFLAEIGMLGPQTLLAHTVHIDDRGIDLLRTTGTFNVHNPLSNLNNGVGIAPVSRMLARGQPVCLGTDGFNDLPQEARLAKLLQISAQGNPGAFTDEQALKMLYGNNTRLAETIFGCRLGRVAAGYTADLILVAYDPVAPVEHVNRYGHILGALTAGQVRTAFVGGKPVLQDGVVLGIDEERLHSQARSACREIWGRF